MRMFPEFCNDGALWYGGGSADYESCGLDPALIAEPHLRRPTSIASTTNWSGSHASSRLAIAPKGCGLRGRSRHVPRLRHLSDADRTLTDSGGSHRQVRAARTHP